MEQHLRRPISRHTIHREKSAGLDGAAFDETPNLSGAWRELRTNDRSERASIGLRMTLAPRCLGRFDSIAGASGALPLKMI